MENQSLQEANGSASLISPDATSILVENQIYAPLIGGWWDIKRLEPFFSLLGDGSSNFINKY